MYATIDGTELFFDVDGASLTVAQGRPVERPTILVLHGGPGGDHVSIRPHLSFLSDLAQVVYMDYRGSGRSRPAPLVECTLERNISDIESLRKHLGIQQLLLLGASYGGIVAQGYALRHPERVARLMLLATAPSGRFIDEFVRVVHERGSAAQKRVCSWLDQGTFSTEERLREYYLAMGELYSTRFDAEKFKRGWAVGRRNVAQLDFGLQTYLRSFDYVDELRSLRCPTLIIGGLLDQLCSPHWQQQMADSVTGSRLVMFQDSAHLVMNDEPALLQTVVRNFVREASAI